MAVTITDRFRELYRKREMISVVTCYDFSFASIVQKSSVDAILVGDSLGMVIQGQRSTLPVTVDEIIYHTKAVRKGAPDKYIISDLPFLSYQVSVESGLQNVGRIMKETDADAVKLEGASEKTLQIIQEITEAGIPVQGHLGLTPQSVHTLGGFKVQGKTESDADRIIESAEKLQEAGVFSIVLEMVPEELGKKMAESVDVPIIGIGAGRYVSGQVLVIYDLLGMNSAFNPRFLKKYADLNSVIMNALNEYSFEVKDSSFPSDKNVF